MLERSQSIAFKLPIKGGRLEIMSDDGLLRFIVYEDSYDTEHRIMVTVVYTPVRIVEESHDALHRRSQG